MKLHYWKGNRSADELIVTLEEEDISQLNNGAMPYKNIIKSYAEKDIDIEVGVEIEERNKLKHVININGNEASIYDSALDALMVMCLAYKDLERRTIDNESYPGELSTSMEKITELNRDEYEVEKAMNTFTYYDSIRRGKEAPDVSDLNAETQE